MEPTAGLRPETTFLNCQICSFKSPLFNFLTPDELDSITKTKKRVLFKAGETIVKQGAPLTHVLSFTNGLAKVYIEGKNNRNLILQFIRPTNFIGGPGIYVDSKHYFTVTAIEDSAVCFIDMAVFKDIIRKNPDFADAFLQQLSRNGIFNYERFISLTQKNMPARIADGLLYLQNEIFATGNYEINISKQDLADLTGMSKDSVIRTLKELTDDLYIEVDQSKITIKDLAKLTRLSEHG
jgi:CRP/FNR family transcriptional regulator, polysaccharide utilization system transcription regulator